MYGQVRTRSFAFAVLVCCALVASAESAAAQSGRGLVVDQTGLPLPGATVQLLRGVDVVTTVVTAGDGTFAIDPALSGDTLVVTLDGFETARVQREASAKIVLSIGRASEETTVIALAPTLTPASPTTALLGSTLTASTVARLPSSRLKARESLPLLPSVVRGPDGLIQLGGAKAHETPVLLDGFNVTDPATGNSSLNLPFESVRGVDALRDPMSVTYGDLLGGVVQFASRGGGDKFALGVQGVLPRPRFASPGFGRLEGIFPRVHASGPAANGTVHYMGAVEYDFERIPVPDVTQGTGPDIVEKSATAFGRVDIQTSPRNELTLEGVAFPGATDSFGLSPRRDDTATPNLSSRDLFGGVTNRFIVDQSTILTVQVGALLHDADMTPHGSGTTFLSPTGWRGNWFSTLSRQASRVAGIVTWERSAFFKGKAHDLTLGGRIASRRLQGRVNDTPVVVEDGNGRTVRTVTFGPATTFDVRDHPTALLARDVWHINDRLQIDVGGRLDHRLRHDVAPQPSGRFGARYALDASSLTVVKVGYGSFVGNLPLAAEAFADYPSRTDRDIDPVTGAVLARRDYESAIEQLRQPRAVAATVALLPVSRHADAALARPGLRRAVRHDGAALGRDRGRLFRPHQRMPREARNSARARCSSASRSRSSPRPRARSIRSPHHDAIKASGWKGRVVTAYRPDPVVDPEFDGFKANIETVRQSHALRHLHLARLSRGAPAAPRLFQASTARPRPITAIRLGADRRSPAGRCRAAVRASHRRASSAEGDAELFRAQMLTEMARMSLDDGLVMQIHPGSMRNHNPALYAQVRPRHGRRHPDPHRLCARAEAPARPLRQRARPHAHPVHARRDRLFARAGAARRALSGRCGSGRPWWFYDSARRHAALPRAHDRDRRLLQHGRLQRRHARLLLDPGAARRGAARRLRLSSPIWWSKHLLDEDEAREVARDLAYNLAKKAYKL